MRRYAILCALWVLAIGGSMTRAQEAPLTATRDWNDRVFYEIFVRSFYDSDGDGIGDLRGVIEKLDYLNDGDPNSTSDLGVTGIWLMPIMDSVSYHGYDVVDYRSIDPDYGTLDDFRALVDAAHARGIVVLIDLVINHTSSAHPWFTASAAGDPAYADWYVWSNTNPGWRGPDGQQVWHRRGSRYYYGLFWGEMPDLNLTNPAVVAEIDSIVRFWLDLGVDGFRMDAVKHLVEEGREQENTPSTHAWIAAFTERVHAMKPEALVIGEVWSSNYLSSDYVSNGEIDLVFDFDVATGYLTAARQRRADAASSLTERAATLYPPGQYATFLTNHDQTRVMNELRNKPEAAITAAQLLLLTPGVPFLYYGEEIGMTGQKPDERIRTPMQWTDDAGTVGFTVGQPWQAPNTAAEAAIANVEIQDGDPASMLNEYRRLIGLRNRHEALRRGAYIEINTRPAQVFAFLRQTENETLLVLMNLSDNPIDAITFNTDIAGVAEAAGGAPSPLPPRSATVIDMTTP